MSTRLAPGSYFGKLADAGLEAIGQNGTPAFTMSFTITHVADNGAWTPIAEVTRNIQLFMTDKARDYALSDLRRLGFNGNFDAPMFATDVHEGLELSLWHEPYGDKIQEKLKIARLKVAHERKPVAADTKRTLEALFKGSAPKAAPAAPMVPPKAPSLPSGGGASDQDPPFTRPLLADAWG